MRIGVPPGTQALRIDRRPTGNELDPRPHWVLWINSPPDFTTGTYLRLYDDGTVERATLLNDGSEDVFLIKPKDAKEDNRGP